LAAPTIVLVGGSTMKPVVIGLGLALIVAGHAQASDPNGIYARIDKVVLEPNDAKPERIQIWGTFVFAKVRSVDDYEKPVKGYLYYALVPDKTDQCRNEWADLKKVAGQDQCVAFGSRYAKLGTIRQADQKPKDPDPYVLGRGLVKVNASNPQAQALKDKAKP
jgi:hypothetical protein